MVEQGPGEFWQIIREAQRLAAEMEESRDEASESVWVSRGRRCSRGVHGRKARRRPYSMHFVARRLETIVELTASKELAEAASAEKNQAQVAAKGAKVGEGLNPHSAPGPPEGHGGGLADGPGGAHGGSRGGMLRGGRQGDVESPRRNSQSPRRRGQGPADAPGGDRLQPSNHRSGAGSPPRGLAVSAQFSSGGSRGSRDSRGSASGRLSEALAAAGAWWRGHRRSRGEEQQAPRPRSVPAPGNHGSTTRVGGQPSRTARIERLAWVVPGGGD